MTTPTFEVSDLQMPDNGAGVQKSPMRLALEALPVGKCLIVSGSTQSKLSAFGRNVATATGAKFATRTLPDGRVGIWRVA